jgi:hypothetical protein
VSLRIQPGARGVRAVRPGRVVAAAGRVDETLAARTGAGDRPALRQQQHGAHAAGRRAGRRPARPQPPDVRLPHREDRNRRLQGPRKLAQESQPPGRTHAFCFNFLEWQIQFVLGCKSSAISRHKIFFPYQKFSRLEIILGKLVKI